MIKEKINASNFNDRNYLSYCFFRFLQCKLYLVIFISHKRKRYILSSLFNHHKPNDGTYGHYFCI